MSNPAYQERIPIYPRSVRGRFRTLKYAILALAYGVYFLLPWLPWERSDSPPQAVLFDIVGRHFYIFDLVVYAQDIFWLAGILVIAAILLFFVTGIAGRVFCGYFCFQTLWTDVFLLIERLVQGDRNARIKLAAAPWTASKLTRIALTHLLWLSVALATGLTFTLYWGYAPELVRSMLHGTAPFPAYATTLFLTLTTYVMAGLAREQVCTYMCPYARFQGVMFDEDTLVVAYDEQRGEGGKGRHKPAKGLMSREERHVAGYGDCIDCGFCVQVCPMGIDIRNGLQYQCISCALCIDACDTVMDAIKYPRGLVRYTSQHALEGRKTRFFKPRNIGYGLVLILSIATLSWSIATRTTVELVVRQIRQPISVTLSDGSQQNSYEIKITNKTEEAADYRLLVAGLPGAALDVGGENRFHLRPESSVRFLARLRLPPAQLRAERMPFKFVLVRDDNPSVRLLEWEAFFIVPRQRVK